MSKEIIAALASATKALKGLQPAPVFNGEAIHKAFLDAGLPEEFAKRATEESAKKHSAIHGDTGERAARIILAEIAPSLGGIDSLASLCRSMRAEEQEKNSVKFTRGELDDTKNEKARAFVGQVRKLYDAGKQVSEIQKELNFYSYQTLYGFVKANPETFPPRS